MITYKQVKSNLIRVLDQSQMPRSKSNHQILYKIYGNGDITLENTFAPSKNMIKFGMVTKFLSSSDTYL